MLRWIVAAALTVIALPAKGAVGFNIVADVHFEEWYPDGGSQRTYYDRGWSQIQKTVYGESWDGLFSTEGVGPYFFGCSETSYPLYQPCLVPRRSGNTLSFNAPSLGSQYQSLSINLTFNQNIETNTDALTPENFVSGQYSWSYGHHNGSASIAGPILFLPGVPETATWLMMIAGFGLIGGMLRNRSAKSSAF